MKTMNLFRVSILVASISSSALAAKDPSTGEEIPDDAGVCIDQKLLDDCNVKDAQCQKDKKTCEAEKTQCVADLDGANQALRDMCHPTTDAGKAAMKKAGATPATKKDTTPKPDVVTPPPPKPTAIEPSVCITDPNITDPSKQVIHEVSAAPGCICDKGWVLVPTGARNSFQCVPSANSLYRIMSLEDRVQRLEDNWKDLGDRLAAVCAANPNAPGGICEDRAKVQQIIQRAIAYLITIKVGGGGPVNLDDQLALYKLVNRRVGDLEKRVSRIEQKSFTLELIPEVTALFTPGGKKFAPGTGLGFRLNQRISNELSWQVTPSGGLFFGGFLGTAVGAIGASTGPVVDLDPCIDPNKRDQDGNRLADKQKRCGHWQLGFNGWAMSLQSFTSTAPRTDVNAKPTSTMGFMGGGGLELRWIFADGAGLQLTGRVGRGNFNELLKDAPPGAPNYTHDSGWMGSVGLGMVIQFASFPWYK